MTKSEATREEGPAKWSLARQGATQLSRAAAIVYGGAARFHRYVMQKTAAQRGRPSCAVVSVGGLTVGGAGKTPVAARLAVLLAARGLRVVLASRGYRGGSREAVTLVSDGEHLHASLAKSGDESLVLASHAPGIPVLIGRDRRVVGHHAVSVFGAEILVIDDGFQHHRLTRDLDLVCVDGQAGFGNGRVLPAGPLREPLSSLRNADWLCLVDPAEAGEAAIRTSLECMAVATDAGADRHPDVLRVRRRPVDLTPLGGSRDSPSDPGKSPNQDNPNAPEKDEAAIVMRSPSWLRGKRVGMIAGIGRPGSLRQTLSDLGAEVVQEMIFPDHHAYRQKDFRSLTAYAPEGVDAWITTEKDALKILPRWVTSVPVLVLRIEAVFDDEAALPDRVLEALRERGRLPASIDAADSPTRTNA